VCREAVPNTRPGSSKASVTKCVLCVCGTAHKPVMLWDHDTISSTNNRHLESSIVVKQTNFSLARLRLQYVHIVATGRRWLSIHFCREAGFQRNFSESKDTADMFQESLVSAGPHHIHVDHCLTTSSSQHITIQDDHKWLTEWVSSFLTVHQQHIKGHSVLQTRWAKQLRREIRKQTKITKRWSWSSGQQTTAYAMMGPARI